MRKFNTLILSLALIAAGQVVAQDNVSKAIPRLIKEKNWKGCSSHRHEFVGNHESIKSNGSISIKDASIANDVTVSGKVRIENSEMASLQAQGHVILVDSDIAKGAQLKGYLSVKNCSIAGSLKVDSNRINVTGSTIDSIVFTSKKEETQRVFLGAGTKVTGPITFANGKGKVYAAEGVEIAGPIEGGEIVKRQK
jgi:hypothetical protein